MESQLVHHNYTIQTKVFAHKLKLEHPCMKIETASKDYLDNLQEETVKKTQIKHAPHSVKQDVECDRIRVTIL